MASPALPSPLPSHAGAPPRTDIGRGLVVVVVFCVLYGTKLGIDTRIGGEGSLYAAMRGIATALVLFAPAYVLTAWIARLPFALPRLRVAALVIAVIAGVMLGYVAAEAWPALARTRDAPHLRHVNSPLPLVAFGLMGLAILLFQERSEAVLQALHEEATRQTLLERETAQARLIVLQAQVEPHFLFNSLAHVRRLYRKDTQAGRAMLRNLAHYLSAMGPIASERGIALRAELELAVAYLCVQQARMGSRLAYDVDVAEGAMTALVPPMIVTTLVENAIKHGLSSLPEGGAIHIEARIDGGATLIRVVDTGRGFQSTIGSGIGLANGRARLQALHGDRASLELAHNEPRGVVARIVIPRR